MVYPCKKGWRRVGALRTINSQALGSAPNKPELWCCISHARCMADPCTFDMVSSAAIPGSANAACVQLRSAA
jgi:hypothetical protein